MRTEILFVVFPYLAAALLVVGLAARWTRARLAMDAARAEARTAWELFSGGRAWKLGLALVGVTHVVGLALPRTIQSWNSAPFRLYLLEGSGFGLGLLALLGWARVMRTHFVRTPAASGSRPAPRPGLTKVACELGDCVFLSLLFLSLVSGLAVAVGYRWASSWSGVTLAPYLASLLRGAAATELVERMPFLVQLHVVSLFALMAVAPATSAALLPIGAVDRALTWLERPVAAGRRVAAATMTRLNPAHWLWPEEDLVEAADDDVMDGMAVGVPVAESTSPVSAGTGKDGGIVYGPDAYEAAGKTPRAPS
jgi:nitrate reductase gamma subunit